MKIKVGAKSFAQLNTQTGIFSPVMWREESTSAPITRATISLRFSESSKGQNVNTTVAVAVPVIQTVGGITTVAGTARANLSFTNLQYTDAEPALAYDAIIAALTSLRGNILNETAVGSPAE